LPKLLFFIFLFPLVVKGQLNQVDAQGRKHGPWESKYETGVVEYRGNFDHGEPIGEFTRYYEDGSLKAKMIHDGEGTAYSKLYYPENEVLMAEGKFEDQKRDSIWRFYSPAGILTSLETYQDGKKEGLTEIYYTDGSVSERMFFENDVKSGRWEQYFENGNPKLKATVIDGVMYDGKYTSYYPNGMRLMEGEYVDGRKEGSWYHFHEDGSIEIIYVYRSDKVVEEHPKNGVFEAYWPNDIKRSEYTFQDGQKHGPFSEWYNQGEWRDEERVDEFGNRYPVQKLYGTQIRRKGKYRNGKLHGEVITYGEDGSVEKIETYDMGNLVE
jgi:antitoxin component YwqK of YwqJK toxin-antitoxin module